MAELVLDDQTSLSMEEHAVKTFPEECCGFMFGRFNDDTVRVESVTAVKNNHPDLKVRRYLISPEDFIVAENYADEKGLSLVGVYHSHPDHPAIPSETDRSAAIPGFTYIIYSIMDGKPADVTAWELAEDRSKFKAVDIVIERSKVN